ncbi:MAG TPA: hypothetical protein VNM43_01400 [Dehalococcoidia bacterium]|nr:hypothetical protein [Dehalococcoidia bacterium]
MTSPAGTDIATLLDRLEAEAEAFASELSREYYLNYAGLKDRLEIAPIYARHAALFSRETVDALLEADDDDPRLPELRWFVVEGYLDQAAKELTERIAERETTDTVEWEGQRIPYRSVPPLVMNEPDPDRRHRLEELRVQATAGQNPLREQRWDLLYARARELGFKSYRELCDRLGRLNLQPLNRMTQRFLWDSEARYRELLEQRLRSIGVEPGMAEKSDVSYLFRSPEFDAWFTRERMLEALDETLRDLGIDPADQPNIRRDTEPRPRKSPRAFCSAIRVPDEVILVINPHGGHDDYRALFHEAGHAEHFGSTNPALPFTHRGLGDNSVTEGFAFVLEHVVYNPEWLRRRLGVFDPSAYLAFSKFQKLYMLRRYAAKLGYEMELHADTNVRGYAKHYADILTAHLGVRYAPEDYLSDVDDAYYAARYLRAWIFEAQVRRMFEERWGPAWFSSREAGARLRELWSWGQRFTADELLAELGLGPLDIGPLAQELLG